MSYLKADLKEYIDSLVAHVLVADQSYFLYMKIAESAGAINRANLGIALGVIQERLADSYILALTKLFEPPSPRYLTRSIPGAIKFLKSNQTVLKILQAPNVECLVKDFGQKMGYTILTDKVSKTTDLISHLRSSIPSLDKIKSCNLSRTLNVLKTHRDKRVAHPEAIGSNRLPKTSWKDAQNLLNYAKYFIGIVGWAFLSTAYEVNHGEYLLSRDAKRSAEAMERLFKMAKLI